MSLASIQSSVQNVMLFCKKRFMIFKINLVNLFLVVIFFKMVIFQMAEFPPTYPPNGTLSLIFSPLLDINKWHLFLDLGKISWQYSVLVILNDLKSIAWEEIPPHIHAYNKLGIFVCFCKCLPLLCNNFLFMILKNQGGEQHNRWNSGISLYQKLNDKFYQSE